MITLNTIIYDGNYETILAENSWFRTFESKYVSNKSVTINNLSSENRLKLEAGLTDVQFIDVNTDEVDKAKHVFKLKVNPSTVGYYYTIPYFVALNNIKTKFILNIATDCMNDIRITDEFFTQAISELENNEFCSTTMIAWVKDNKVMNNGVTIGRHENFETFKKLNEKYKESKNFNYSFGFTDQFFMGSIEYLKQIDFNIPESESNRIYNGPSYGGNSFEKRMVGHQVLNKQFNCIHRGNSYYIHDGNYYN